MPAQIKVSITSQYYSGGGAIDIRVKNIPTEWGFVEEKDIWGHLRAVPSPALRAVLDDLESRALGLQLRRQRHHHGLLRPQLHGTRRVRTPVRPLNDAPMEASPGRRERRWRARGGNRVVRSTQIE
ncbi:hypothetical protein ACU686_26610 [Yinghuangia aomiensis]